MNWFIKYEWGNFTRRLFFFKRSLGIPSLLVSGHISMISMPAYKLSIVWSILNWQGQTWANSCPLQRVWNCKENGYALRYEFFRRSVARDREILIARASFSEKLHMRKTSTRDIPFTNLAKTENAELPGSKPIHSLKNSPLTVRLQEGGLL